MNRLICFLVATAAALPVSYVPDKSAFAEVAAAAALHYEETLWNVQIKGSCIYYEKTKNDECFNGGAKRIISVPKEKCPRTGLACVGQTQCPTKDQMDASLKAWLGVPEHDNEHHIGDLGWLFFAFIDFLEQAKFEEYEGRYRRDMLMYKIGFATRAEDENKAAAKAIYDNYIKDGNVNSDGKLKKPVIDALKDDDFGWNTEEAETLFDKLLTDNKANLYDENNYARQFVMTLQKGDSNTNTDEKQWYEAVPDDTVAHWKEKKAALLRAFSGCKR